MARPGDSGNEATKAHEGAPSEELSLGVFRDEGYPNRVETANFTMIASILSELWQKSTTSGKAGGLSEV